VRLDFHIYNIIDFDLLLGYPLEKLLNASHGSLDGKLREAASTTATSCLENPMMKPLPKQNPLDKKIHISPFVPSERYYSEEILHLCEDEQSLSPSIEFEPLPAGLEYAVLDHNRDPTINLLRWRIHGQWTFVRH
jgi:hypothetical protein